MRVYGADKIWKEMHRGKVVLATICDMKAPCPMDRVNRLFLAERPNPLWVSDFTYVST